MKQLFNIMFFATLLYTNTLYAQQEINIYPGKPIENNEITNKESYSDPEFLIDVTNPRMLAYPAPKEKATGAAVIICPGGGYFGISIIKEGSDIAKWFNNIGITAFVLYYRMPNTHHNIPLNDAQAAMKTVYTKAKKWNINRNKIGIIGFSAGGHLAATVGTHFTNKIQRPAFMILAYPVISMKQGMTHGGSRLYLLGKTPTDQLVNDFSNELHVKTNTPPTFMVHAKDDNIVPVENCHAFKKALEAKNISVKYVEYEKGGHGFGMRPQNLPVDQWNNELKTWLLKNGFGK